MFSQSMKNVGSLEAFGNMAAKFRFEDETYDLADLSAVGQELIQRLVLVTEQIEKLNRTIAVFNRAKNGYIEDLKQEVVEEMTGLQFSDLIGPE
jgi:hypothetical protein